MKEAIETGVPRDKVPRFVFLLHEREKEHAVEMERLKKEHALERQKQATEHDVFVAALKMRLSVTCKRFYVERLFADALPILIKLGYLSKKAGQSVSRTAVNTILRNNWMSVRVHLGLDSVLLPDFPELLYGSLSSTLHTVPPLFAIFASSLQAEDVLRFWEELAAKYDAVFEVIDANAAAYGQVKPTHGE